MGKREGGRQGGTEGEGERERGGRCPGVSRVADIKSSS